MGGFFVYNFVLAEHTATATTAPEFVAGGSTDAYGFTVTNNGADSVYKITISVESGSGFLIDTSTISCPAGWTNDSESSSLQAVCMTDVFSDSILTADNSVNVAFNATSPTPTVDTEYTWGVATRDVNEGYTFNTDTKTTVDVTAPTILSITTKDTNGDGNVEMATIVFSEAVDDSTFSAGDFICGSAPVITIDTGGIVNDNTFDIVVENKATGTEAKVVVYTAGSGADMVGNPLASFSQTSTDEANPVLWSTRTKTINTIELAFSEDLDGTTDAIADFSVEGYTITGTSELNGVITLTLGTNFGTGETPNVGYVGDVKDLAGLSAPVASPITFDGIAPILETAVLTNSTTVELTFSEDDIGGYIDPLENITLKGINPTGFFINEFKDDVVVLTFGSDLGTSAITDDSEDLEIAVGAFEDNSKNALLQVENQDVSDGAKPTIVSVTANPSLAKVGDVTITVVFSEAMNSTAPTFSFTGIIGVIITQSDGAWSGNTWTEIFTLSDANEEATAIIIVSDAVDLATPGNVMDADSTGIFDVDTLEPTVTITLNDTALKVGETAAVTFAFSEVPTGFTVDDVTVIENGTLSNFTIDNGDAKIYTATLTPAIDIDDNENVITVGTNWTDVAGNAPVGPTSSASYDIDTFAPAITSVISNATTAGILKVGNTIIFTVTPTIPETGLVISPTVYNGGTLIWLTVDGTTYTATYTVEEDQLDQTSPLQLTGVTLTDLVGNIGGSINGIDVVKTIDANTPGAPTILATDINIVNSTMTITGTGEANAVVSYSVKDKEALEITGVSSVDGSENINITSIDVSALADGNLTASATLTDAAGNVSSAGISIATKDMIAPVVNITAPLTGAYVNSDTVITFATDSTNSQCSVDDTNWTVCASGVTKMSAIAEFSGVVEGASFTLYFKDADTSGNIGADSEGGIIKDTVVPATTLITSPVSPNGTSNWYVTQPTITLTCADDTSGCDKIYYKWGTSGTYAEYTGILTASEGTDTLYYYSVDVAGNDEEIANQTFKVDLTDPNVEAGTNKIVNALFTQDATVDDSVSGVASYLWTDVTTSGAGTITFGTPSTEDTTIEANGTNPDDTYTIRLTVVDNAGKSSSDTMTLVWDKTNPVISSFISPVADTVYIADIPLTFTATDANSVACSYTINGGTLIDVSCLGAMIPNANLNDGRNALVLSATDSAGNTVSKDSVSFVYNYNKILIVDVTFGTTDVDFINIQEAINKATEGDTINVSAGTYAENLTINKALNLVGAGKNITTINGNLEITANDVSVTEFTISAGGVLIDLPVGVTSVVISNNILVGQGASVGGRGVLFDRPGVYGVNITNNTIHDLTSGVYLGNSGSGIVNIENNEFYNNTAGIGAINYATVKLNYFHDNAEDIGIADYASNYLVQRNKFNSPVINYGSISQAFAENWWGSASGPIHADNPNGIGIGSLSGNFNYRPWCTNESCDLIDETAPIAILPDVVSPISSDEITLSVSGDQVVYYKYDLDDRGYGAETPFATAISETGLSEDSHIISVIGRDQAGNWQAEGSATTYTWTVDTVAPTISKIEVSPNSGTAKVGDTVILTITADAVGYTASVITVNSVDVTAPLVDNNDNTYTATYLVVEGNLDVASGAITASVILKDTAGNENIAYTTVTANTLAIDANTPVISSVTSDATGAGWLKIGDTVTFTVDVATTETGLTITPATYNGGNLTWTAVSGGDIYTATYTVEEGQSDQTTTLQLTGAQATDPAGNVSIAVDGSDVAKTIDANTPTVALLVFPSTLQGGSQYLIKWDAIDDNFSNAPIKLKYSDDNKYSWNDIVINTANDGEYSWLVPNVNSSKCYIKITVTDLAGNNIISQNVDAFGISVDSTSPTVELINPNGGENWQAGSVHNITWDASDNITAMGDLKTKLDYSKDGGTNWTTIIESDNNPQPFYQWTVPEEAIGENVAIRIIVTDEVGKEGSSARSISITEAVVEPTPICTDNGGGTWTCDIQLNTGWNLISLPVIFSNTDIATVLTGINDKIILVKYYNSGEWLNYVPGQVKTLTTMEDGKGYWVNMTNPAVLTVTGTEMPEFSNPSPTYEVVQGWNLIGLKSTSARMLSSTYLQSLTGSYILSDENNVNRTDDYMNSGEGYWLWMNQAGNIVTFNEK